jgi:DNA repair protein RadA/Sms
MTKGALFVCQGCGYETYKWMGKCPRCGAWDTIKETIPAKTEEVASFRPVLLADEELPEERIVLGIEELDRVLGGGMTRGSSILLGGDPGIGKTTLCFAIASTMTELGFQALYVSGEESLRQLSARRRRLSLPGNFPILTTNRVGDIIQALEEKHYELVIIDSIQSIFNAAISMLPGSIGQIRDVSTRLVNVMKGMETTHVFIGHVTKEGTIAGPKVLEHMVDTVLYFEGDKMLPYRMVRAFKNRYGPVDEVGIFQMRKDGLTSIENPSAFFISERDELGSGSALYPYVTGSRPILLEVQAVAPKTNFSNPRRLSLGYDANRLFILLAVLEKALSMPFFDRDVYVNVTGGMKVDETGVDLAVAAAILSSVRNQALGKETALFGEIGLTGEIRKIVHMEMRVRECLRLGIKRIFCPGGAEKTAGIDLVPVKTMKDLIRRLG